MLINFYWQYQIDIGMWMPPCNSVIVHDNCWIYKHVPICDLVASCRWWWSSCKLPDCVCNFLGSLNQYQAWKILVVGPNWCLNVVDKSALIPKDTDVKFAVQAWDTPWFGKDKIIWVWWVVVTPVWPPTNRVLQISYNGPKSYLDLNDTPNTFDPCADNASFSRSSEFIEDINFKPYVKVDATWWKLSHDCEEKYFAILTKSAETLITYDPTHEVGQRGMWWLDIPLAWWHYVSHNQMKHCDNFIKLPKKWPWLIWYHANVRIKRWIESFRLHPFAVRNNKIITLFDSDPGGGDRMMAWPFAWLWAPFMADTDEQRWTDYVYNWVKLIRGREWDLIGLGSKMNCQNYWASDSHPNTAVIRYDNFNSSWSDTSYQDICSASTNGNAIYNQDDEWLTNMCYLWAVYVGN